MYGYEHDFASYAGTDAEGIAGWTDVSQVNDANTQKEMKPEPRVSANSNKCITVSKTSVAVAALGAAAGALFLFQKRK